MMSSDDKNDSSDAYSLEPEATPEFETDIECEVLPIQGVRCKQCGYDLSGLSESGACPECGLAIERSLTEDLLEFSAPVYLASLHRGVFFILTGIILKVLIIFGSIGFGFSLAMSNSVGGMRYLEQFVGFLDLIASMMVALGWWLFSAPDPAFTGQLDGSTARKVVRVTTIITAGIAVVLLPIQFLAMNTAGGVFAGLAIVLGLISLVSWVTGFFAAMLYLRWLAPRLPDWRVYQRSKTLMWLGPVLYTVGSLCIGLGPLIALVLYWNMLNWVRIDLKEIRENLTSQF
jgi:hypothetical protein